MTGVTGECIVYDNVESALASVSPSVAAQVYGVCTLYFNRWMLGYGFPGMHLNKYLGLNIQHSKEINCFKVWDQQTLVPALACLKRLRL